MDFMEMWEQMGVLAKAVVFVLAIMSVWSIGVMIERYLTYRSARVQSRNFVPAVADALGYEYTDALAALSSTDLKRSA